MQRTATVGDRRMNFFAIALAALRRAARRRGGLRGGVLSLLACLALLTPRTLLAAVWVPGQNVTYTGTGWIPVWVDGHWEGQYVEGYLDTRIVAGHWDEQWVDGHEETVWVDGYWDSTWNDGYWDSTWNDGYSEDVWNDGHWEDVWNDGYYDADGNWNDGYWSSNWVDGYWSTNWVDGYWSSNWVDGSWSSNWVDGHTETTWVDGYPTQVWIGETTETVWVDGYTSWTWVDGGWTLGWGSWTVTVWVDGHWEGDWTWTPHHEYGEWSWSAWTPDASTVAAGTTFTQTRTGVRSHVSWETNEAGDIRGFVSGPEYGTETNPNAVGTAVTVVWTPFDDPGPWYATAPWLPDAGTVTLGATFTQTAATSARVHRKGERNNLGEERNVTTSTEPGGSLSQTAVGTCTTCGGGGGGSTKIAQPDVSSADATITLGQSFTPTITGGAGTGAKQAVYANHTNWGDSNTFTPYQTGAYSFWVRQLTDSQYLESNIAGPYTLTVSSGGGGVVLPNNVAVTGVPAAADPGGSLSVSATATKGTYNLQTHILYYAWNSTAEGDWQQLAATPYPVNPTSTIGNAIALGQAGILHFKTTAWDTQGASTTSPLVSVNVGGVAIPVITSPATAVGAVAAPFAYQIVASGAPASFAATGLPAWLALNATTGALTGVPPEIGTFTVTLTAANTLGTSAPLALTITITPAVPVPRAYAAEQITSSRFLASWSAVPGAIGYRLDVSANATFTNLILSDYAPVYIFNGQSSIATSQTVTGLAPSTDYWYRVRAVTNVGTSLNSTAIAVRTTAPVAGAPSLWFEKPRDVRDANGNWTKVDDGLKDEIIPAGGAHGLTYYVLDYRYTGDTVTFYDNDFPTNDWWYPRNVLFDYNGDGSADESRPGFTPFWQSGITFSYTGEIYQRLGVEFDPEQGYDYDICYSTNDTVSPSSLSVVNGGGHITAENNDRMIFALFNEFTVAELNRGSLYLVRYAKPLAGVVINLPGVGDVTISKSGVTGAITLPDGIRISSNGSSTSITRNGVTVAADANGNSTLSLPNGVSITAGPGGGSLSIPGGVTLTVNGSNLGISVPAGLATTIGNAVDSLGRLLGLGGPDVRGQVVPVGGQPAQGAWGDIRGILLGDRPPGVYDIATTTDTRGVPESPTPPAPGNIILIRLTVAPLAAPLIAVDANRNGVINFDASDATSAAAPYRFWLNDDDDSGDTIGSDVPSVSNPNYLTPLYGGNTGLVQGARDLIDWFPVALNIKQLLSVLPPSASVKYKLKHAAGALNFVYTDRTRANAFDYQRPPQGTTPMTSGFGPDLSQAPTNAYKFQITADGVDLFNNSLLEAGSTAFLDAIKNHDGGVILIEGRVATTAPLVLSIEENGAVRAEAKLYLSISGVESMFRHLNLHDRGLPNLVGSMSGGAAQSEAMGDPVGFPDYPNSNDRWLVFVHGYNVDGQASRGWNAEMFKRLYWSGSKARFIGVSWFGNPDVGVGGLPSDYHRAVRNAMVTAQTLAAEINALPGTKTIFGHSLGTGVISSAIADYGMNVSKALFVNAALARECYDGAVAAEANGMTPSVWRNYDPRLYASNWHERFSDTTDARKTLTWRNRFGAAAATDATSKVYNFYSSTEDVLAEYSFEVPDTVFGVTTTSGLNGAYTWVYQEKAKGMRVNYALGLTHVGSYYWGWGPNIFDPILQGDPIWYFANQEGRRPRTPDEIGPLTYTQLEGMTRSPFFQPGWGTWNPNDPTVRYVETTPYQGVPTWIAWLFTSEGKNYAADPLKRNQLLAEAIPALTWPMGSHETTSLISGRNLNLPSYARNWPRGSKPGTNTPEWRHNDIREVAYLYLHGFFEQIVALSNQ